MPRNVDQIADAKQGSIELARLARLCPFPDFVLQAPRPGVKEAADAALPASVYADPVRQQFPCDTKANTWLSALFFGEKKAEFHQKDAAQIEKRLHHFVDYWHIRPAVAAIEARSRAASKTAADQLPDSAFAWVRSREDGNKDRRLRLTSALEVKAAADWLEKYRDELPFRDRCEMARRVLTKAGAYGVSLGQEKKAFLERQAGRGVGDPALIVRFIQKRAALLPVGDLRTAFEKIAASVEQEARRQQLGPDRLVKLAETLERLDFGLELTARYKEGLQRPEDVLFSATFTKAAEELHQHVATTTGHVFEKEELCKLGLDDLRSLFGDDFVERVRTGLNLDPEKLAQEVSALPRPDAEMFENLLSDNGIAPVMRKVASVRKGLAHADLLMLAGAYGQR